MYFTVTSTTGTETQGTENFLSSATEVIPNGDNGISITGWSFTYPGYLVVSYTATNTVNLSYTYGATTVSTPNSETESGLTMPVKSGGLVFNINNQACGILGCPSITMTLTVTYYYGY